MRSILLTAKAGNRNGMRTMARMNRDSAFRVGTGGETYSINTLNGGIYVRKANR